MTREKFDYVRNIPVENLQLDVHNARIRAGADQADCIARLLRKPKQLLALATDIAETGLTTAPILVQPNGKNRYVVWDGNRRVTALKLLNNPSLCPVTAIRHQLEGIRNRADVAIPDRIDVHASKDEEALLAEVLKRHGGQRDGVGQVNWSAFLRTVFLIGHGHSAADKRAGQLFMWAEEHGVDVDDEFPITSITRFLSKENLKALGFEVTDKGVKPLVELDKAIAVAQTLAADFAPGGSMKVESVFTPEDQRVYIARVRSQVGLAAAKEPKPSGRDKSGGDQSGDADDGSTAGKPGRGRGGNGAGDTTPKGPTRQTWDRKFLFSRSGAPGFSVPESEQKVTNIVVELRRLDPFKTPLAVAALFRMLMEFSTKYYMKRNRNVPKKDKGHLQIAAVAEHMHQAGKLDAGELKAVVRRTRENEGLLNYDTLNAYIHALKAHPSGQGLNTLWDEVDSYVKACWLP